MSIGLDYMSDATPPLVGVRPEVIAEAAHAFGNLFHRLHYHARKLRGEGVEGAGLLEETIGELEDFLRLVLDYTSPVAMDLQQVAASVVLGSVSVALGVLQQAPAEFAGHQVAVDPSRLSEAFQLIGGCLGPAADSAREVGARVESDAHNHWLTVAGVEPDCAGIARARSIVAWALAQKVVEAHGGSLNGEMDGRGLRWTLRLPISAHGE